jgi:hypothetical protein
MRFGAFFIGLSVLACASFGPRAARAVGPRVFDLDSLEKLSGGDLHGVAVGSDGVVRAGFTLSNLPLPADAGTTVTCALALADGSVLLGTGPASGGKVVRVANDAATIFADTKESAVNALAMDRAGTVYAATTSGRIYRVAQGRADLFATLPGVDSVFALAVSKSGALYAGTGSDGDVFRISPAGAPSVYFKTGDPFVVSLALGDAPGADEVVFAGTSGKGLIYRITAPGRATVLYDPPGEDVHALAVGPNRMLYAVANEEPGGAASESTEATSRRASAARTPAGPSPIPRAKPGKGSLWRFDADGRPERMMHHDDFHYLSLAVDSQGTPYVGTGADGRVYTVDDAHAVALVADLNERQIGAIGPVGTDKRTGYVIGSDPATFHRVLSVGGADAVWTSKTLDAGLRAHFGHLTWRGTGKLEVSTRTGDTPTPDSTWSAWSAPIAYGGPVQSPGGRFVQVRARLGDAAATIADVKLPFVTENLRAVVTDVEAHDKSGPHEAKEGLPASGGPPPKHDAVVHVTWKVDNPDNDELRYEVRFRQEGQARWLDATSSDDVLTKPELDWDTSSLPEGKYRLRVEASDELANPPAEVTRHGLESAPVVVDNTPPFFKTLGIQGHRLRGEVVDGVGPIVRVEVAVDGKVQWRPIAPVDGIFDTADESFDADIAAFLPPSAGPQGSHVIAVRAFDAAGNAVVRDVDTP